MEPLILGEREKMKKEYELLSGEKIDLSTLSKEEQEHVGKIEELIENAADYFEVERTAFAPLKEGKSFNVQSLRTLYDSPRYKVLEDLVERYRQKCY